MWPPNKAQPQSGVNPLRPRAGGFGFDNYKRRPARTPFPLRPCAGGFGFDNYKHATNASVT